MDYVARLIAILYVLMHMCDVEIDYKSERITKKVAVFRIVFDILAIYIFISV